MAQTKEGASKIVAQKAGVSFEEFQRRVKRGEKWCYRCKKWLNQKLFGKDSSRYDGFASACLSCRKGFYSYVKKGRAHLRGRSFVPAREGDALQARRRINYFVEVGIIPHPNKLSCVDCGHVWRPGGKRHEYDHYLGYAAENHEKVQSVCSVCHIDREMKRKRDG